MRYKNGYVDTGKRVNVQKCPRCGSGNYKETISREKCNACGYEVDYWGQGANKIAEDYYAQVHAEQKRREQEEREKQQKEWDDEYRFNGNNY